MIVRRFSVQLSWTKKADSSWPGLLKTVVLSTITEDGDAVTQLRHHVPGIDVVVRVFDRVVVLYTALDGVRPGDVGERRRVVALVVVAVEQAARRARPIGWPSVRSW